MKKFIVSILGNKAVMQLLPIELIVNYLVTLLGKQIAKINSAPVRGFLNKQLPSLSSLALIPFDEDPHDKEQLEDMGKQIAMNAALDALHYLEELVKQHLGKEDVSPKEFEKAAKEMGINYLPSFMLKDK